VARSSKYEHLKSEILEQFAVGKTVGEISRVFPEVPRQTLRDWHSSVCPPSPSSKALVPPATATRNEIDVTAQTVSEQETVDSVVDSVSLKVVPF